MRTTIDLDDDLAMLAKKTAVERRSSLKALVEQGLRRILKLKAEPSADPVRGIAGVGKELWKGVDPDRYVREAREDWT